MYGQAREAGAERGVSLVSLVIWKLVLEAAAITLVFTKGSIFKRLRESGPELWKEFAHCPLCVGVWVGWAWRMLHLSWPPAPSLELGADVFASGSLTGVLALFVSLALAVFSTAVDRWSS